MRVRSISPILVALLSAATTGCAPVVFDAVMAGDAAEVARLLADGADANEIVDGRTPLCEAITRNHEGMVKALLAAKADPNVGCVNDTTDWLHPLELAATYHRAPILTALLDAGADPKLESEEQPLLHHIAAGQWDEDGAEADAASRATANAYLDAVVRRDGLPGLGAVMTRQGPNNRFPLTDAASACNTSAVEVLLERGANPKEHYPAVASGDEWPVAYVAKRRLDSSTTPLRVAKCERTLALLERAGSHVRLSTVGGRDYASAMRDEDEAFAAQDRAAEAQRQLDEIRRREEQESEQAMANAAFGGFVKGMTGPSTNPMDSSDYTSLVAAAQTPVPQVDGLSMRPQPRIGWTPELMARTQRVVAAERAAALGVGPSTPSQPPSPAAGSSSSTPSRSSSSSGSPAGESSEGGISLGPSRSSSGGSGSIVVDSAAPLPAPTAAPPSVAPPPESPRYVPPPPKPNTCREEKVSGRAGSLLADSEADAREQAQAAAHRNCATTRSPAIINEMSCREIRRAERKPRYDEKRGWVLERVDDYVQHTCDATYTCEKPKSVCPYSGPGKATRQ